MSGVGHGWEPVEAWVQCGHQMGPLPFYHQFTTTLTQKQFLGSTFRKAGAAQLWQGGRGWRGHHKEEGQTWSYFWILYHDCSSNTQLVLAVKVAAIRRPVAQLPLRLQASCSRVALSGTSNLYCALTDILSSQICCPYRYAATEIEIKWLVGAPLSL